MRTSPLTLLLQLLLAAPAFSQPMPVTGEILISVSDAASRLRPGVAADPSGGFAVVWREVQGQDGGISGRRLSAEGRPAGAGFVIEPRDDGRHTTDPRVVARADGSLLAAWGEAAYLRPGCAKARRIAGPRDGEDGEIFDLGACANENGRAPKVALAGLPGGRFTAAWEEGVTMTAAGTGVVVRTFAGPEEPLADARRVDGGEGTEEEGFQTDPAVAQDAAGRSVALWYDGTVAALLGRRFDAAGQPLGAPFRVDSGGDFVVETAVAAAPGGRFVAVWSSYEGGGTRIVAQRFDAAGRKQGPPVTVSPGGPSRRHRDPAVAVDAAGNFIVAWDADKVDAGGTGVLGRLFDRGGKPQGPAFRINTTGPGSQGHPAVAFARSGRFLVVWDSQKNVSGRGSIVGRLYAAAQPVVP